MRLPRLDPDSTCLPRKEPKILDLRNQGILLIELLTPETQEQNLLLEGLGVRRRQLFPLAFLPAASWLFAPLQPSAWRKELLLINLPVELQRQLVPLLPVLLLA